MRLPMMFLCVCAYSLRTMRLWYKLVMSGLMILCVDDVPYGLPKVVLRIADDCPSTALCVAKAVHTI